MLRKRSLIIHSCESTVCCLIKCNMVRRWKHLRMLTHVIFYLNHLWLNLLDVFPNFATTRFSGRRLYWKTNIYVTHRIVVHVQCFTLKQNYTRNSKISLLSSAKKKQQTGLFSWKTRIHCNRVTPRKSPRLLFSKRYSTNAMLLYFQRFFTFEQFWNLLVARSLHTGHPVLRRQRPLHGFPSVDLQIPLDHSRFGFYLTQRASARLIPSAWNGKQTNYKHTRLLIRSQ